MSVSGFKINGATEKYNFPDLDNISVTTQHIADEAVTDSKLASSGIKANLEKLREAFVKSGTRLYSSNADGGYGLATGFYAENGQTNMTNTNYVRTYKNTYYNRGIVYAEAPNGYEIKAFIWRNGDLLSYTSYGSDALVVLEKNDTLAFNFKKSVLAEITESDKAFIRANLKLYSSEKAADYIAPEYDEDQTYNLGELVMHGQRLYECKQEITTSEPWNGEHWKAVTVSSLVQNSGISLDWGEVEYDAQSIAAMPSVYSGKGVRIDVGETIDNAYKYNDINIKNVIVSIPKNSKTVTYRSYHTGSNYGCFFLDQNDRIINGYANRGKANAMVTLSIPAKAVDFFYAYYAESTEPYIVFNSQTMSDFENNELGLHTKPDSIGVVNAIKRARQITDIKWSPAYTIPRTSSTGNLYFEDSFIAEKEYCGIPYSDTLLDMSRIVGITVPFDTFVSSLSNSQTVEGVESEYSTYAGSYYGCSCTGLTSYALDLPYTYSMNYSSIDGMNLLFPLISNGVRHSLSELKLCDIIQISGHCAIITDLFYSDSGELEYIEVSEQTRGGNFNKDILGSAYGGKARRFTLNIDEFFDQFGKYNIMRYNYVNNVTYTPNKFSPVDEGNRLAVPMFPVVPYYGEKSTLNSSATCKLIIAATGYTHLIVTKNGEAWNENGTNEPYSIENATYKDILCDSDEAIYTAYLATYQNGDIQYRTVPCTWYVKGNPQVTASVSGTSVSFVVKTTLEEFIPWFANVKHTDTTKGTSKMIFGNYDYEYSNGYHTYTFSVPFTGTTPTTYLLGMRSDTFGTIYLNDSI